MLVLSEAPKLLSVVTPDTPKVLESVVAPDTPKVLFTCVAPPKVAAPVAPKVPTISRVRDGLARPMPTRPFASMRRRSEPLVLKATLFAAGRYMPLPAAVPPVGMNFGAEAVPVTPKVPPRVVLPVTPSVPPTVALPTARKLPFTSRRNCGSLVPTPTLPLLSRRRRSTPAVLKATSSAVGRYMPLPAVTLPVGTNFEAVAVLVTPSVPPSVVFPVTFSVLLIVVAPSTCTVFRRRVVPVTSSAPVIVPLPATVRLLPSEVAPVTVSVLLIWVAPLRVVVPATVKVLLSVVALLTARVLESVVAPDTPSVPLKLALPALLMRATAVPPLLRASKRLAVWPPAPRTMKPTSPALTVLTCSAAPSVSGGVAPALIMTRPVEKSPYTRLLSRLLAMYSRLSPVSLKPASKPSATLPLPEKLERSASTPTAVLLRPMKFSSIARTPSAVLRWPRVFWNSALVPNAEFSSPPLLATNALVPTPVLPGMASLPRPTVTPLATRLPAVRKVPPESIIARMRLLVTKPTSRLSVVPRKLPIGALPSVPGCVMTAFPVRPQVVAVMSFTVSTCIRRPCALDTTSRSPTVTTGLVGPLRLRRFTEPAALTVSSRSKLLLARS